MTLLLNKKLEDHIQNFTGRRGGLVQAKVETTILQQNRGDYSIDIFVNVSVKTSERMQIGMEKRSVDIVLLGTKSTDVTPADYYLNFPNTELWYRVGSAQFNVKYSSNKAADDIPVNITTVWDRNDIGRVDFSFVIPKDQLPVFPEVKVPHVELALDKSKPAVVNKDGKDYNQLIISAEGGLLPGEELAANVIEDTTPGGEYRQINGEGNNPQSVVYNLVRNDIHNLRNKRVQLGVLALRASDPEGGYRSPWLYLRDVFPEGSLKAAQAQYPLAPKIEVLWDNVAGKKPDKPYSFSNTKVKLTNTPHPITGVSAQYTYKMNGRETTPEVIQAATYVPGHYKVEGTAQDYMGLTSPTTVIEFDVLDYTRPDVSRPNIVRGADKTSLIATYNLKYTPIISSGKDINKGTLRIQVPASNYDKSFEINTSTKEIQNELLGAKLRETIGSNITFTYTDATGASDSETVYVETDQSVVFTYNKNGIGIKKEITRGALDVHGDIYTDGHYKLGDGRIIPKERLVAPGGSVWYGDADTNIREEKKTRFALWSSKDNPAGRWGPALNIWAGNYRGVQQVWGYNGRVFMRASDNASTWTWTPWKEYAWKDDIADLKKYIDDLQPKTIVKQNVELGYGLQGDFYKTGNIVRVYFHGSFSQGWSSEVRDLNEVLDEDLRPERDLRLIVIPASAANLRHWGDGNTSGARLATMELLVFPDGHMKQYAFNIGQGVGLTGSAMYWTNN